MVDAILSHLVIDLWWEGHDVFAHSHGGSVLAQKNRQNEKFPSVIANDG